MLDPTETNKRKHAKFNKKPVRELFIWGEEQSRRF